jgi:hypothetical protein
MDKPSDSKEKRKHPRVETNKSVAFRVDGDPGTSLGMVFNASHGGFLLKAFKDIPIGTQIVIEVVPPRGFESAKGCVVAEIVWKDMCLWDDWEGHEYGIKFIRTSNKSHPQVKRIEPNQAGLREESVADSSGHNEMVIIGAKRQGRK